MNKRFIRLLGTAAIALTISSCGTTTSTQDVSRDVYVAPEALRLNTYSLGLVSGKTKTLVPDVSPAASKNVKVSYKSENSNVARVDANGNVTGVSGGATTVTVTAGEGDSAISVDVPVYVGNASDVDTVKSYGAEQLQMQKDLGRPEAISVHEVRNMYSAIGGVNQKGYTDDCLYVVSEAEGYLGLDGYEKRLKTAEGTLEPSRYAWTFFMDEDYITYLYHISDGTKNRMSLPTQSYIGQPRINGIYDLINNLFTRGKEIIVDQNFSTVYETENLEDISGNSFGAFKNNDLNIILYSYTGRGPLTIDPDSESNYEIPANTTCQVTMSVDLCFVNGVCAYEFINQDMSYDIDGVKWTRSLKLCYDSRINDDVEIVKPNNKEYNEVYELYDL